MTIVVAANPQPTGTVIPIQTVRLRFDPENPRFYRLNDPSIVADIIEEMLDDEGVQDLMLSIGQKGYFQGEPLLAIPLDDGTGDFIVVEGNRRLAATKLLNGELQPPLRRAKSVAVIRGEAVEIPPIELPCLVYTERREILRYLGYRHITGIKEWDSLSKAKYLAQLRDEFYPTDALEKQLKALAKDIGSRADYVAKLLTALNLYTRAENKQFFGLRIEPKDVEFSYLTTAIGYSKISSWLGLQDSSDVEVPNLSEGNLQHAFAWMFVKDQQGKTIVGESRNFDKLAAIVAEPDAVLALVETGNLEEAYLFSKGPQAALEFALEDAIGRARIAWALIPKTQDLTQVHLTHAESLSSLARDIRNSLRDKLED